MKVNFTPRFSFNNIQQNHPKRNPSLCLSGALKKDSVSFNSKQMSKFQATNKLFCKKYTATDNTKEKEVLIEDFRKEIQQDLKEAIKNNDAKAIFDYFGFEAKKDKDGLLTISHYTQPNSYVTFSTLGIDEDKIFEKVKEISGDAKFSCSQITNLGNLESIKGDANFCYSEITNLGKLKNIGGYANFGYCKVKDLAKLKSVGGSVFLYCSKVENLGDLKYIGKDAYIGGQVKNLGNLEYIGGNADFSYAQFTDLSNLKHIEGNAIFCYSPISNFGALEYIGGYANFKNMQVADFGKLKHIEGNVYLSTSDTNLTVNDFKNIKHRKIILEDARGY